MTQQQAWWRFNRFPLFVAARTLSIIGDFAAAAALTVHLYQDTGSGLTVAGFFAARIVPRLFGPLGGALADRFPPQKLLVFCDVVALTLYLTIAWLQPSYFVLLGMVLVTESAATVSAPAARTMIAKTVPAESRAKANSVLMMIATISMTVGSGLGGLVTGFGYQYALVINASSFLASAILLSFVPARSGPAKTAPKQSALAHSALAGVRALLRDRQLRLVAFATAGTTFAIAVDRPALIGLVESTMDASSSVYGLVLGTVSLGGLLAATLTLRSKRFAPSPRVFAASLAVLAVGHLAISGSFGLAVLFVAALIAGIGTTMRDVSGMTLLQGFKNAEFLGVVMGTVMSGTFLADMLGSLVGGLLTDAVGPRVTYVLGGSLMALAAALALSHSSAPVPQDRSDPVAEPVSGK